MKVEDSTVDNGDVSVSADPVLGVLARKPQDFQIFINIVDFCK